MATQTPNVVISKFLSLSAQDFLKGLLLTTITSVLTIILEAVQTCGFSCINWTTVETVAGTTIIGYLLKNLLSPTQVTIQNPTNATVNAVKEGAPVQVAGQTVAVKNPAV
jgi:hypothetical protein